jgi:hypothetical protein
MTVNWTFPEGVRNSLLQWAVGDRLSFVFF